MGSYSGSQGAHTPSTTKDNYVIDADGSGEIGKVVSIGWGGRLTTSTGYRTRWARPTTIGSGIFTAVGAIEIHGFNLTVSALLRFGTFGTDPVLAADPAALHAQDWNAHGGLGFIVLPLANPWWIVNGQLTGQVACRNIAGVDANGSSYTASWEE